MRSVSRIKKILVIVLAAAIATVAMALPVFASTPLPSSTPNPIYPSHIDATLKVYYTKFFHDTTFTADKYIDVDGTIVDAVSSRNFRLSAFVPISPSVDKMLACRNSINNFWFNFISITFYDSSQNVILGHNYAGAVGVTSNLYSWTDIPDNAAYFRFCVSASTSVSLLPYRCKICISPEVVAYNPAVNDFVSDFWRGYLSVVPYATTSNGHSVFIMSADVPFNALYAEITLSQSYHIASYVSARVYTTVKDGAYDNSFYPVEYNDRDERDALPSYITLLPFYIDSNGNKVYPDTFDIGSELSDNPATLFCYSADNLISGFNLNIPLNNPTGLTANSTVQVDISNIAFDDMSVVIPEWSISTVNQIENAVAAAEVPVPSFDLGDIVVNAISNVDFNAANNLFGWFWGISIVASMTALVGMFCLIGYVFFGKKG